MYAELMGNRKKHGIKSLCVNTIVCSKPGAFAFSQFPTIFCNPWARTCFGNCPGVVMAECIDQEIDSSGSSVQNIHVDVVWQTTGGC